MTLVMPWRLQDLIFYSFSMESSEQLFVFPEFCCALWDARIAKQSAAQAAQFVDVMPDDMHREAGLNKELSLFYMF